MRSFECRGEQWSVRTNGLSSGWNPMNQAVEFRRRGDESRTFISGQVVFIGGGLERVSEEALCESLAEGLRKHGPTDA
jgi:hypothetical protein